MSDARAVLEALIQRNGEGPMRELFEDICAARRGRRRPTLDVAREAARIAPVSQVDRERARRELRRRGL